MPDYNIYIHNLGSGQTNDSPTTAWKTNPSSQTTAWQTESETDVPSVRAGIGYLKNQITDEIVDNPELKKAAPVVAAAIAAFKGSVKIAEYMMAYAAKETGNYHTQKTYENIKSTIRAALNPVGIGVSYQKQMQEERLFNAKQEQERALIGESFSNYDRRRY